VDPVLHAELSPLQLTGGQETPSLGFWPCWMLGLRRLGEELTSQLVVLEQQQQQQQQWRQQQQRRQQRRQQQQRQWLRLQLQQKPETRGQGRATCSSTSRHCNHTSRSHTAGRMQAGSPHCPPQVQPPDRPPHCVWACPRSTGVTGTCSTLHSKPWPGEWIQGREGASEDCARGEGVANFMSQTERISDG